MASFRRSIRMAALALVGVGAVAAAVGLATAGQSVTAFRREFVVEAPREAAWRHFARAKDWPSWATYIRQVEVVPDGDLTAETVATIHLHSGPSSTFRMREFDPYRHWMWSMDVLWFRLDYDHAFEPVSDTQTKMILHMRVTGFGKSLFGRVIESTARRDLDAAISRLIAEMKNAAG